MRRVGIVALCLVAVLACGAMVASAAQAAEVGECLKTVKNGEGHFTAKYTDKACTAPATKLQEEEGKANKWEWSPGVAPAHRSFTGKTKYVEFVGQAGTIVCRKGATIVGEWTAPETSTEQITYRECEFKGGVNECHSAGQEGGVIVSDQLVANLIGHGETGPGGGEPASGEVWDSLAAAEPSGIQMEYLCATLVEIRTLGSVAGVYAAGSVNEMAKKDTIEFNGVVTESPGKFGEQDLFAEAAIGGGPFEPAGQTVEKTTLGIKNSGKIEIRS